MITIINPYYPIDDSGDDDTSIWSASQVISYLEPGDFDTERHSVTLRRGTQGEMFASTSLKDYEIVFTTDSEDVFVYTGANKKLVGACVVGTYEQIPSPVVPGKLYYASDISVLFLTNNNSWLQLTYSPTDIAAHINALSPHAKHAVLNDSNTVIQNPASATVTPAASSIPISLSDSRLHAGWLPDVDCGALA
jgi:hypothetical protein